MTGVSQRFMVSGVLAVLIGMVWGIQMSATHDHGLSPAHAHLNLIGFVGFAIFAVYYHLVPDAAASRLASVHFWLALAGVLTLVPGIVLAIREVTPALAQIGSLLTLAQMALFGWIVVRSGEAGARPVPAE